MYGRFLEFVHNEPGAASRFYEAALKQGTSESLLALTASKGGTAGLNAAGQIDEKADGLAVISAQVGLSEVCSSPSCPIPATFLALSRSVAEQRCLQPTVSTTDNAHAQPRVGGLLRHSFRFSQQSCFAPDASCNSANYRCRSWCECPAALHKSLHECFCLSAWPRMEAS